MNGLLMWFQDRRKLILLIILTTLLFRLPTLFIEVFNGDETHYATAAMVILKGGLPYVDFVDKKPPLLYYIYAVTFKIFWKDIRFVHFVALLFIFATSYFIYRILKLNGQARAGLLGALFYGLFSMAFIEQDMWAANAEVFMALPMTLSVYFFLKGHHDNSLVSIGLSGFFLCIGLLIKQQAGILYPLYFVALIYFSWNRGLKGVLKALFLQGSILVAASLIPIIAIVLYYYSLGHLKELVLWNITYNFLYIDEGPEVMSVVLKGIFRTWAFIMSCLMLWVLAFYYYMKRKAVPIFPGKLFFLVALWTLLTFPAVFTGGRLFGHYYFLFYPSIAVLGGLGADYFLNNIDRYVKWTKMLFVVFLFLTPLFFLVFGMYRSLAGGYQSAKPFIKKITRSVEQETDPTDRIFSWGLFPYPYYYANRLPASKFIACEYLVPLWRNRFHKDKKYYPSQLKDRHKKNMNILLKDLNSQKPRVIIDVQRTEHLDNWNLYDLKSFPRLYRFIKQNYELKDIVEGVYIYKLKKN